MNRDNTTAYMNGAFTNLRTDLGAVGNPVGTRFFGGAVLAGITDLTITASDPHKLGERVMLFNFGPAPGGLVPGPDRQIVYKPRDVRMDALLVGNRAMHGEDPSMADLLAAAINPPVDSMPRYNFLSIGGHEQDYGYVECLSHGTRADCVMTPAQGQMYYQEMGRQAAMFMMLGVRDLHQTNVYSSGGRPKFTDLEIAFDESSLSGLKDPPRDVNGDCDVAQGSALGGNLCFSSSLSGAFHGRTEMVRVMPAKVQGDRLVEATSMQREYVTDSFVWIQGNDIHGNLVDTDNAMDAVNPGNHVPAQTMFSADFQAGFNQTVQALAQMNPQDIDDYLDSLDGVQVRVHPLATGEQLAPRQVVTVEHLADTQVQRQQFLDTSITRKVAQRAANMNNRPPPGSDNLVHTRIKDAIVQDLLRGDVAYFTRELGGGHTSLVHHHPNAPVNVTVDQGTGNQVYFPDDGPGGVAPLFPQLRNNTQNFRNYVLAMGAGFTADLGNVQGGHSASVRAEVH